MCEVPLLTKAPLVEVIFELRWGKQIPMEHGVSVDFDPAEQAFLPGEFKRIAEQKGFREVEALAKPHQMMMPYQAAHRFRKSKDTWPCLQIGMGILTVNQVNEGYEWESFRKSAQLGLTMLEQAHPHGLKELPGKALVLRYLDGFLLPEGEQSFVKFMSENLAIRLQFPDSLLESEHFEGVVRTPEFAFTLEAPKLKGKLVCRLQPGQRDGKDAFVANIAVISSGDDVVGLAREGMMEWFEKAHTIQREFFRNFLEPKYIESLK